MATSQDREVEANFEAFRGLLPDLLATHPGHYAVLRRQKLEGVHRSLQEAIAATCAYPDRLFSIQEVTNRPADLGLFSHAVNTRVA